MLTDLTFLDRGKPWPPASEAKRLQTYQDNRSLFEADHAEVFKESLSRTLRTIGELGLDTSTSYELCVNYFKLISVTTAGMLFNKAPGIIAGKERDDDLMQVVQDIDDRSDLQDVLFACALDASRYGDGLLYVHKDETGKGIIDISRPDIWFPVVDAANLRRVLFHVLATPYEKTEQLMGENRVQKYLRVEIHSRGMVEIRDYQMQENAIGMLLGEPRIEQTGIDGFAVIPVNNLRSSDRVHGVDDYNDIQSLVCELEVRLAQISRVLDRHTDPTMQGPEEALTDFVDPDTKEVSRVFIPGKYFINGTGGAQGQLEYITWDAELESNFKQIEKLLSLIRVISEMGALLSDMSDKTGAIPSGAAMRRMLYGAISKISRLRNRFTAAIRQAFIAAASLSGADLKDKPIYIDWPDVLPRDPLEQAQIADYRTGGKQTQSVKRAIMELDELDEDDAEAELESIRDEQAAAMPMLDPNRLPMDEDADQDTDSEDEREGV